MNKLKSLAPWLVAVVAVVALMGTVVKAESGFSWEVVMEKVADKLVLQVQNLGQMIGASGTRMPNGISADSTSPVAGEVRGTTLTITGAASVTGALTGGTLLYRESSTNLTATTTLTEAQSGSTFYVSGLTSTWTLPATSSAIIGANYRFVVGGALTVTSSIKTASGADEIEGTLIVAGAVVDCDAEDEIVFGAAFENIGDYVEFRWSGTYWMLGDSGALTSGALACTKT